MFEHYQLKNKANVYLIPLQDTKSVTGLVMFPVGSRYEPANLNGVSHYIEHLMFKGTTKRKNTLTLTREIDRLGAEYNAFTGKETTGYYVKADASYTKIIVDILSDMLYNSLFDPKEMEREKGVVVEELRMYRDNPMMNIDTVFESLMFKGSPLGWDIGGTPELVMSYKRDAVLRFRDEHYDPSAMTIVFAGAMTKDTKLYIEEFFAARQSKKKISVSSKPAVFGPAQKKTDRLIVDHKKADQAQMMIGFPGFHHTEPHNPTMSVLNTILGGSMSSRLFIQIRERRGLAYVVRSGAETFRDTGYAYIRAGLDPKNINKAVACIFQEITKMIEKGVTARELADAKTHIRGALTLSLEDSSNQADWYVRQALFMDRIYTPEERLQKIEAVTREDVQNLAQSVYKMNQARIAIIGSVDAERIVF